MGKKVGIKKNMGKPFIRRETENRAKPGWFCRDIVSAGFFLCCFLTVLILPAGADIVKMKDAEEIPGVILRRGENTITFALASGDKEIDLKGVEKIIIENGKKNLIFLADRALKQGDSATAYRLYTKVLETDPDNIPAVKGIAELDPEILDNEIGEIWVMGDERYQGGLPGENESQILSADSSQTEELLSEFGLILSSEFGRIKVTEVVRNSRAWEAGVEINDFLAEIDGRPAFYMGLFDAVAVLLNKAGGRVPLEVEREVKQWVGAGNDSLKVSVLKGSGDNVGVKDGFAVSEKTNFSNGSNAGAEKGDILVSVDGIVITEEFSLEDVKNALKRSAPNSISMVVRRKLVI